MGLCAAIEEDEEEEDDDDDDDQSTANDCRRIRQPLLSAPQNQPARSGAKVEPRSGTSCRRRGRSRGRRTDSKQERVALPA